MSEYEEPEPDDPDKGPGIITTEWTFWCGLCSKWETIATENVRAKAIKQARRQGWRLTRSKGWICPRKTHVVPR